MELTHAREGPKPPKYNMLNDEFNMRLRTSNDDKYFVFCPAIIFHIEPEIKWVEKQRAFETLINDAKHHKITEYGHLEGKNCFKIPMKLVQTHNYAWLYLDMLEWENPARHGGHKPLDYYPGKSNAKYSECPPGYELGQGGTIPISDHGSQRSQESTVTPGDGRSGSREMTPTQATYNIEWEATSSNSRPSKRPRAPSLTSSRPSPSLGRPSGTEHRSKSHKTSGQSSQTQQYAATSQSQTYASDQVALGYGTAQMNDGYVNNPPDSASQQSQTFQYQQDPAAGQGYASTDNLMQGIEQQLAPSKGWKGKKPSGRSKK